MKQLVLMIIALLAIKTSSAFSQDTCAPAFESCMSACGALSAKGQERCIESCQAKNSACYGKSWGIPSHFSTNKPGAAAQPADAMAKDEQAQAPKR